MTPTDPTPTKAHVGRRGMLALAVAAAVDGVGGVRRSSGPGVEVATQYAGGRVVGVDLGVDQVTVHVVAERLPLDVIAERVRSAARGALQRAGDGRPVTVAVDDLDLDRLPRLSR